MGWGQISVYQKAIWYSLASDLEQVGPDIRRIAPSTSTDTLLNMLRKTITKGVEKHIPIQTLKNKASLSYITPEIGKLIRKRDGIYKKKKKGTKEL